METPDVIEDFFCVYLLYCMNEKYLGRTYIGYTVDPNRRISQHNKGAWAGGARKTSNRGPWKMIMIIHGFPNNISALRFEWAWQNPEQSRRFNHVENRKKMRTEKQLAYRLRILSEMLRIGPWNRLPLTIRWLAENYAEDFPPNKIPPIHMPICYGPVKSKKIKNPSQISEKKGKIGDVDQINSPQDIEENVNCSLCHRIIDDPKRKLSCLNDKCDLVSHMNCLAEIFLVGGEYIPIEGDCPFCSQNLLWGDLIRKMKGCKDIPFDEKSIQDGFNCDYGEGNDYSDDDLCGDV